MSASLFRTCFLLFAMFIVALPAQALAQGTFLSQKAVDVGNPDVPDQTFTLDFRDDAGAVVCGASDFTAGSIPRAASIIGVRNRAGIASTKHASSESRSTACASRSPCFIAIFDRVENDKGPSVAADATDSEGGI